MPMKTPKSSANSRPSSSGPFCGKGLKISSAEDRVFEAILSEPRMSVAFGGPLKASGGNRLRLRDRVFAKTNAFSNGIAWLEIVGVLADGYEALVLDGADDGHQINLSLEGKGVFNDSLIEVEAVDDGIRLKPNEYSAATNAYLTFRELGVTTSFEAFKGRSRPKTNLIHLNEHRHAIVNLCFGQHFVAGNEIWMVTELLNEGFVASRTRDARSAIFHADGICIDDSSLLVQAAILSEGEFDQEGWDYEIGQHLVEGFPCEPIFHIAPGALAAAMPGQIVVINFGSGLNASSWEVVGKTDEDLLITGSQGLATLCLKTGQGTGLAKGGHFLALAASPVWVVNDPGAMVRKVLLHA